MTDPPYPMRCQNANCDFEKVVDSRYTNLSVENRRREAYKAWAYGWFLRNVLRRDAEFSLADVEQPQARERRNPIRGSGPWYAKTVRVVGLILVYAQAIRIADWLLPMAGLNPPVDAGTLILALIGVALVYLASTLSGPRAST